MIIILYNFDLIEMTKEKPQLIGENERLSVSLDAHFGLTVIQKVAKVDMEKLTGRVLKHKVARMSVPYPQDVSCDTLPSK